ncbi:MAG: YcaO-like family protein, partial [Polyangiales bacterium]
ADLLARCEQLGITRPQLDAFVEELAHARRGAGPLPTQRSTTGKPARLSRPRRRSAWVLGPSPKAPGSLRFCLPLSEGEREANIIAAAIGVTRIALVGELDELGVQVAQAYRPDSPWSTTAGSGKSETRAGARIGGVLEEAEKYAQERFTQVDLTGSYRDLTDRSPPAIDPSTLDLPYDSRYQPDLTIGWTRAFDLLGMTPCLVPSAAVIADRLPQDIYYSARRGEKIFSSSGLASGFTLEEALTHGLCELIERHALRMAELQLSNPGIPQPDVFSFVDLATAPASVQRLARKLTATGHTLRVLDITSEVQVPTFEARLYALDALRPFSASGTATHPNAEVALQMALLEAAQTKIGAVSGSREDLSIAARSLGRHERPRPFRPTSEVFWYGADPPLNPFSAITHFVSRDAYDDLRWVLAALARAGVTHVPAVDYSLPALAPMRAVRVLTPGLESANPFHTGLRARTLAIRDLLPRPREGARR